MNNFDLIYRGDALQAHPEYLNEQIDDHDKAMYAKGWNSCNEAYFRSIVEIPSVSADEVNGEAIWLDKYMTVFGARGQTYHRYGCSRCKGKVKKKTKFCPSCGAKMKGM